MPWRLCWGLHHVDGRQPDADCHDSRVCPAGIPAVPDATPAVPSLVPEGGEVLLVELTGGSGSSGSRAKLEKAKTFVTWTCVGSGPITVSLGTLESSTAQCTDSGEATVHRNEFMNDTVPDVAVNVEARPGQQWKVTISQVRKK